MTNKHTKTSCALAVITAMVVGVGYLMLDGHLFHLRGDDEWVVLIGGAVLILLLVLAGCIFSAIAFFREKTILSGICLFLFLSVVIVCISMLI